MKAIKVILNFSRSTGAVGDFKRLFLIQKVTKKFFQSNKEKIANLRISKSLYNLNFQGFSQVDTTNNIEKSDSKNTAKTIDVSIDSRNTRDDSDKSEGEMSSTLNNKFSVSLKYKFNLGVVKLPQFMKRKKGGEDAVQVHEGMICIADGVGGWNEMGIDPSLYSNELCENVKKEYLTNGHKHNYNPKSIFCSAAKRVMAKGSSTFCMCTLDFDKKYLHTVNLGDSGYMIIRDIAPKSRPELSFEKTAKENGEEELVELKTIFKSDEQQHQFNFPYQCGTNGDPPEECQTMVHEFRENDIIILGTDGLWDNVYEDQIIKVLQPFYETSYKIKDLNLVANLLAELTEKLSLSPKYKSPFSVKSRGLYLGGKTDDITIVIAQIVPNKHDI